MEKGMEYIREKILLIVQTKHQALGVALREHFLTFMPSIKVFRVFQ